MTERFPDRNLELGDIVSLFADKGCTKLFVKELAWNHDSKRQIYISGQLSFFNTIPVQIEFAPPRPEHIPATEKEKGQGKDRIFAHLDFTWLGLDDSEDPAPNAKMIYYPQYPEIRFSGFLQGTHVMPSRFLAPKSGETYGNRLLFFGIRDRKILGLLAVGHEQIRDSLRGIQDYNSGISYNAIPLHVTAGNPAIHAIQANLRNGIRAMAELSPLLLQDISNISELLPRLRDAVQRGWMPSCKLSSDGRKEPYSARNGGGYTLEAELGVIPNGDNEPDLLGWEIKQHAKGSSPVTLITPEPDMGLYRDDFHAFMEKYGYADSKNAERLNFGGIFRNGKPVRNIVLRPEGYDPETGRFDIDGLLGLWTADGEALIAGWSFRELMGKWSRKHSAAAYVTSSSRKTDEGIEYQFHPDISMGAGTSFSLFLKALHDGTVYLDPALKWTDWKNGGPVKKRNQFRIKVQDLPELYYSWHAASLKSI